MALTWRCCCALVNGVVVRQNGLSHGTPIAPLIISDSSPGGRVAHGGARHGGAAHQAASVGRTARGAAVDSEKRSFVLQPLHCTRSLFLRTCGKKGSN